MNVGDLVYRLDTYCPGQTGFFPCSYTDLWIVDYINSVGDLVVHYAPLTFHAKYYEDMPLSSISPNKVFTSYEDYIIAFKEQNQNSINDINILIEKVLEKIKDSHKNSKYDPEYFYTLDGNKVKRFNSKEFTRLIPVRFATEIEAYAFEYSAAKQNIFALEEGLKRADKFLESYKAYDTKPILLKEEVDAVRYKQKKYEEDMQNLV